MKITSFKQIKEIIAPIPADQFCTKEYQNKQGQCCFLGHINKINGFGARELTKKFIKEVYDINFDGADVNDSPEVNGYTELEIKDRLMHMIEDGIIWEESKLTI
jgi:hypothetical protein